MLAGCVAGEAETKILGRAGDDEGEEEQACYLAQSANLIPARWLWGKRGGREGASVRCTRQVPA